MERVSEATAKDLEALFCARCEYQEMRQSGRCPKGQTTCGAKIVTLYTLNRSYAGIPVNSSVRIKDIFWAMDRDYATVTISTSANQRYGVPYTLLNPS